ncbi:hypothetical protein [Haloechinothrix sp. LS1_15]|uniref:hypothetical protein n=1 Tax=Haloechinothrix sp. LS1_15 TaxID=2652248 RepID=UPI00294818F7|nr:hypothetical protein [Haloechinothrix sp. LS1_15]MDV6011240.1 hypothetical protein [Haloechinothrix sp. LS1_15]
MAGDGFSAEEHALRLTRDRLRLAADTLDRATGVEVSAVDAGMSSDIVADALARLQQVGIVLAQHMDNTADQVDAAEGSYAEIENTHEGKLRYEELAPEEPARNPRMNTQARIEAERDSPLEQAPIEERGPNRDGRAPAPELAEQESAQWDSDDGEDRWQNAPGRMGG